MVLGMSVLEEASVTLLIGVSFFIWFALCCYPKTEKEICEAKNPPLSESMTKVMSKAANRGDDIGDAFLQEIGVTKLYGSDSVLRLAKSSGPAGQKFARQFTDIPCWVDFELVRRGAEFQRNWITAYIVGGLGTIIESYGYSNGAKILMETGRLSCATDATRRLLETAVFSLDVIEHGLLLPDSPALETVARVRMLHCMVRKHMRSAACSKECWDESTMGAAVNQEDGVHTIFLNSHSSIRAMELQGIHVSEDTKEGISMLWAYCGFLLGIDGEFLPKSYAEEKAIYQWIFNKSFRPDENSFKLTEETIKAGSGLPPSYFSVAQEQSLARMLLGSSLADAMRIQPTHRLVDHLLIAALRLCMFIDFVAGEITGYRVRLFNSMSGMRENLMTNLQLHGKGYPTYRFLLARKQQHSSSASLPSSSFSQ